MTKKFSDFVAEFSKNEVLEEGVEISKEEAENMDESLSIKKAGKVLKTRTKNGDYMEFYYNPDRSLGISFKVQDGDEFGLIGPDVAKFVDQLKSFLRNDKEINESMVDGRKLLKDEGLDTNVNNILAFFNNSGFKTKFDVNKSSGVASYKGVDINFETGNENLYMSIDKVYVKSGKKETINEVKKLIDIISNNN